ncbi:MAG TPA: hypothetical protein VKT51_06455 [Candidatus Eremiobacteraceae bacterium]|nr:hypothetical protein [Candidatus Eremiobacteraceae bacterium]
MTPPNASGAQVIQYVQVQYRNVVLNNGRPSMGSNLLKSALQTAAHQFLSNLLQTALTHANPVLGFIAQQIAAKAQAKLASSVASRPMHLDPRINVAAEFEATTTVAADRTRTDIGDVSTIIQCDLRKVIVLDNAERTYSVTTFDQAESQQQSPQFTSGFDFMTAALGGSPDETAAMTISPQPDDGAVTIAGLTARHAIFSLSSNGGGSGQKTDLWYADIPVADHCSLDAQSAQEGPSPASAGDASKVRVPLRSVEWTEMQMGANEDSATPASTIAPSDYVDPMLKRPGFAWLETTSVAQLRYDPAFFDVPAGYALVTPAPTDTPSPGASSPQRPVDSASAAPAAAPSPSASPAGAPR